MPIIVLNQGEIAPKNIRLGDPAQSPSLMLPFTSTDQNLVRDNVNRKKIPQDNAALVISPPARLTSATAYQTPIALTQTLVYDQAVGTPQPPPTRTPSSFEAEQPSDLRYRPYRYVQEDSSFAAPAAIARGEFLASFVSQWLSSDQLRRQYKIAVDLSAPYAVLPAVAAATATNVGPVQPSDLKYRPYRYVQQDNSFSQPIGIAQGEFLASFVSQWLSSDQLRPQYKITIDLSVPFSFPAPPAPAATPSSIAAIQPSDLRYRPYRYLQQDYGFAQPQGIALAAAAVFSASAFQSAITLISSVVYDQVVGTPQPVAPTTQTPTSVAAVQPSDLRYRPYRYVQLDYGFAQPVGIARGEFLASFISQWLNSDKVSRAYRISIDLSAPYAQIPPPTIPTPATFEAEQASDLRYRPYKYVQQDNSFAQPEGVAAGEFLANFVSQWLSSDQLRRAYRPISDVAAEPFIFIPPTATPRNLEWVHSDQLRRQYKITPDLLVPYAFFPFVGTQTTANFDAEQPSDLRYRPYKYVQQDYGFAQPEGVAAGEFLATFISQWLNSDLQKRAYKITPDVSVPYSLFPFVGTQTVANFDAEQASDLKYRPYRYVQQDNAFAQPIGVAQGEFLASFISQWINSDQLRRVYHPSIDAAVPFIVFSARTTPTNLEWQVSDAAIRQFRIVLDRAAGEAIFRPAIATVPQWTAPEELRRQRIFFAALDHTALAPRFIGVATPFSVGAVQPSDLRYRPYRYVQQDYGFAQPVGVARGEFLASFVSQWINSDQLRRPYRPIVDSLVPYALFPPPFAILISPARLLLNSVRRARTLSNAEIERMRTLLNAMLRDRSRP